jgi:hypothetical protein
VFKDARNYVNRGAHVDGIHNTPLKADKQALNLGGDHRQDK